MKRTINFKLRSLEQINQTIYACNDLALATGLGTTAADILVALAAGKTQLTPTLPALSTDATHLTLPQLLERCAAKLDADPVLAEELRHRVKMLREVGL